MAISFFLLRSFESLASLASKLPQNKEVREKAQQLEEERRVLERGWQQKDDFLRQTFDLQIFNKEADQIDAATSSHEAFLEFSDLGVSSLFIILLCYNPHLFLFKIFVKKTYQWDFFFVSLQSSLDDVEALQKRHDDFENSLAAQDERLKSFSEAADKLIAAKHYDSKK